MGELMRLSNKVALISGGGSGIGKASCLLFAREGAKVVVVDLKKDTAEATAKEIGTNARAFAADVSKAKDAEAMIAFAEWIAPNFSIDGFWTYVGTVLVIWAVNWIGDQVLGDVERRARPRLI